jgi:molecular chaperone DnaJ
LPVKARRGCAAGRQAISTFSYRSPRTHYSSGEFEVPSIDGSKTRVKVPPGTQSGRRFRLSGKGMPVLRARQSGDMYVQVIVETPQNLTKRQRELLAEFDKLSSTETHPEAAGFFARVKEFFGSGVSSG